MMGAGARSGSPEYEDAEKLSIELAQHLEALMLTNRALLEQLNAAKRQAEEVQGEVRAGAAGRGRRQRDWDDDGETDDDGQPRYRSAGQHPFGGEPIPILSANDSTEGEFDAEYEDDIDPDIITYRSATLDEGVVNTDDDLLAAQVLGGSLPLANGKRLNLVALGEIVAALRGLVAQPGCKDVLVHEQLQRLEREVIRAS